ncbi:MAG: DUF5991 domain-containing protein [Pyrinomonadaceae bacterium]
MNSIGRAAAVMFAVLFFCFSAFSQNLWLGTYEFVEDGGKTAGGTVIVVTHQIDVLNSDDGLVATLKSNGYQTSVDLLCLVKVQGAKAMLHFEGYGDDNIFEPYTKGQLMLTLETKQDKGKNAILTHWAAFKPSIAKNEKSGKVYFARTTNTKL